MADGKVPSKVPCMEFGAELMVLRMTESKFHDAACALIEALFQEEARPLIAAVESGDLLDKDVDSAETCLFD